MNDLSQIERDYLANLLAKRHTELLHEIHHAVHREYKVGLREEIDLAERLQEKLVMAMAAAG